MTEKQKQAIEILNRIMMQSMKSYDKFFTEEDYFVLMDFVVSEGSRSPVYIPYQNPYSPYTTFGDKTE